MSVRALSGQAVKLKTCRRPGLDPGLGFFLTNCAE
jgi:hypothetical protein